MFHLREPINSLLYIKARAEEPLRWGVTANVIKKLQAQSIPWAVVLLYVSENTGYILSPGDVNYYTNGIWAIGADGDYKPSPGSYLTKNKPFHSIEQFIHHLYDLVEYLNRE